MTPLATPHALGVTATESGERQRHAPPSAAFLHVGLAMRGGKDQYPSEYHFTWLRGQSIPRLAGQGLEPDGIVRLASERGKTCGLFPETLHVPRFPALLLQRAVRDTGHKR